MIEHYTKITCDKCHYEQTFSGKDHNNILANGSKLYGYVSLPNGKILCDDCYSKYLKWCENFFNEDDLK